MSDFYYQIRRVGSCQLTDSHAVLWFSLLSLQHISLYIQKSASVGWKQRRTTGKVPSSARIQKIERRKMITWKETSNSWAAKWLQTAVRRQADKLNSEQRLNGHREKNQFRSSVKNLLTLFLSVFQSMCLFWHRVSFCIGYFKLLATVQNTDVKNVLSGHICCIRSRFVESATRSQVKTGTSPSPWIQRRAERL